MTCWILAGSPDTGRVGVQRRPHVDAVSTRPRAARSRRRPAAIDSTSTLWTSSWSLPATIRLMSSKSEMSCACTRVLRATTSRPRSRMAGILAASHHQLRPRQDRIQRRSQLVRDHRHEVVLHAARALGLGAGRALGLEQPIALGDGGLPLGDVAGNLRDADDRARVVEHRRDRQRDMQPPSVFGDPLGLEVVDALAATNTREDLIFLGLSLRRDEDPDVRPINSAAGYPNSRSAAPLADWMMPSRFFEMIASSDESTIAARYAWASAARRLSVMSKHEPI